jgi:hypothetical protein
MENLSRADTKLLFDVFDATATRMITVAKACDVSPTLVTHWRKGACAITAKHLPILEQLAHNALQNHVDNPDLSETDLMKLKRLELALAQYGCRRLHQYTKHLLLALNIMQDVIAETGDQSALYVLYETLHRIFAAKTESEKEYLLSLGLEGVINTAHRLGARPSA